MKPAARDLSIITNADALKEDHVPPLLSDRDSQIEELRLSFIPIARRRQPRHCWIHGPPGAGKTSTVRFTLSVLEREAHVYTVYVNCWQWNSLHAVLEKTLRSLGAVGGVQQSIVLKLERLQLLCRSRSLVIALDEIDRLAPKDRSSLLYDLSSIQNVGILAISNSSHLMCSLEERVLSRLQLHPILFSPYSAENLLHILQQRARSAIAPDTWDSALLLKIAEISRGDARTAISTLRSAAIAADAAGADRLDETHLHRDSPDHELRQIATLDRLTEHHRIIFGLIKDRPGIYSGPLRQAYVETCQRRHLKPIASRTFCDYPTQMARLGLIRVERVPIPGKVRSFQVIGLPRPSDRSRHVGRETTA